MSDRVRLRQLASLKYFDPVPVLVGLRKLESEVAASPTPENIKTLRTPGLRPERESRDAALFALVMSAVLGRTVLVAPQEADDFDFVTKWTDLAGKHWFTPVQHKEVPPETLNPNVGLQDIIAGLSKYANVTVAIKLNRAVTFEPAKVVVPSLKIAALWIYGALTPDQNEFGIWGDFLAEPSDLQFWRAPYPQAL
jgi:hypothetical protein